MKALALIACLALIQLLWGCARADIRDEYDVTVESSFSTADQASIIAGLDDWQAKVPVRLHVTIGLSCPPGDGQICIQNVSAHTAEEQAGRPVSGDTDPGDGAIWLDTVLVDSYHDVQMVSAHEVGHAMGLVHEGPGNLMSPGAKTAVPRVTCNDAAQWYQVRGRVAPACVF